MRTGEIRNVNGAAAVAVARPICGQFQCLRACRKRAVPLNGRVFSTSPTGGATGKLSPIPLNRTFAFLRSVYVTLGRMADKGLITSRAVKLEHESGMPRRLFAPTGLGERVLNLLGIADAMLREMSALRHAPK